MFDLAKFALTDSIDLGASLRKFGGTSPSIERTANQIIQFLYRNLVDGVTTERACVLARLFKTHRFHKLNSTLQEAVPNSLRNHPALPDCRCLTLLATAGEREEWNDPMQSRGHRVIPLLSPDAIEGAPMLSRLFAQFGLELRSLTDSGMPLLLSQDEATYSVFHVPVALGSPYIPAQKDFVERFGIRSVIGFGAPLSTGELFAILLFTRVSVTKEIAELFRLIALNVKFALLPYDTAETILTGSRDDDRVPVAAEHVRRRQSLEYLAMSVDTLHQLLIVHDQAAKIATQNLESRNAEIVHARDEALKTSNEKARILSAVHSFFICVDEHEIVTNWTAMSEKLFGIQFCEAVGHHFMTLPIYWPWDEIEKGLRKAEDTITAVHLHRLLLKGNSDRFLNLTISPSMDDQGIKYILMGEDVTERLQLERDLAQAQKLESIGQLAAGIAHEINTPIQFVGDNVRFLSDSFSDISSLLKHYQRVFAAATPGSIPRDLLESCEAAYRGTDCEYLLAEIPKAIAQSSEGIDRVATIVRAMKDFAHPGRGEKTTVNLNTAIQSTVTVARNEWKYVADLHMNLDSSLPPVPCLVGEFNQVVLNMIVNATHAIADVVKGTGRKGTITITTVLAGNCAEIRIEDTGTGIPEAIRHKIFDPFFTTKEVGKGTGQGLAIARSVVVDKHGGTIAVESEVGKGTTFIIHLPLAPSQPDALREVA